MGSSPFRIDDELAAFLDSAISILIGTRNAALVPNATRLCGLRVAGPDRVHVLLPRATGVQALANLRDNGDVAVIATRPKTYRSMQLKGRFVSVIDATEDDVELSRAQLEKLSDDIVTSHGSTPQQVRNMWLFDLWRVVVHVTSGYVQTPGPGAGRRVDQR